MNKYISIRVVLDNILDHPLLRDVSLERAINYTQSFIRIVGCPQVFNESTETIHIDNYRGLLPCDFSDMIQVRLVGGCSKSHKIFRASTDNFHMSDIKHRGNDLTYKIQGSVIYTSMKEGDIEVAYRAIAVDSDGYPLVPDNSSFIRALELYIKKQCFTTLFDLGKISPAVYNNVLQEYAWAVGDAQSDLIRPNIDEMENIKNMWNTLISRNTDHSNGFKNNGRSERIKVK